MGSMTDARTCADCPADISQRRAARRCEPCAKKVKQKHARRRYAANPEKYRGAARRYAAANREGRRLYRAANLEKGRERMRRWRDANPDKAREAAIRDREKNRNARATRQSRRYASLGGAKPRRWLPDAIARQGGICTWCSLPLPDDPQQVHADHIYPVSRGGETSPENTAALHAVCNMAKGARVAA